MNKDISQNPLEHLDYFAEWGGRSWEKLLYSGFDEFLGRELKGIKVLEIGSRYGKMSCLFAMIGAQVVGIDINQSCVDIAYKEAKQWDIEDIKFLSYKGDLDVFEDETFDIVFTKSVLVLIPNLKQFLIKISSKLKPGGKVLFLENAFGNPFFQALRKIKHRKWNYKRASFFNEKEITIINNIFDVHILRKTIIPPIYLIGGYKRS